MIFAICENTAHGSYRRIVRAATGPDQAFGDAQCEANETAWPVDTTVGGKAYCIDVSSGEHFPRPQTPYSLDTNTTPADGATPATLTGLETGTEVAVAGQTVTVDGGTLVLTFAAPGAHDLKIVAPFPALPAMVTIHAT